MSEKKKDDAVDAAKRRRIIDAMDYAAKERMMTPDAYEKALVVGRSLDANSTSFHKLWKASMQMILPGDRGYPGKD